jgi:hypothetical protein
MHTELHFKAHEASVLPHLSTFINNFMGNTVSISKFATLR